MCMKIDWTKNELLLHRASVLHQHGRSEEFAELVKQQRSTGVEELSATKYREREIAYHKTIDQLMDYNDQLVESLINSYFTTESKEWAGEVARRLSGVLEILEGVSDFLGAEIDIESYNLSANEVKIEERLNRILNREDEFYKILVDFSSRLIEDRRERIKQRERTEELMMKIRAAGI